MCGLTRAVQGALKERFSRAPFVKYFKPDTTGLVGFDKALTEEDIKYVRENLAQLGSRPVTWEVPDGKSLICFNSSFGYSLEIQRRQRRHSK